MSDRELRRRLVVVEAATVGLAVCLLIGLVSLALAPFAAGALTIGLWRLGGADVPPPLPRRLRLSAFATGLQAILLGSAGIVALTVGRPSTPFTVLNSVAGISLLVGLHFYVDGWRGALEPGSEPQRRFNKAWRALRFVDVVLVAGLVLGGILLVFSDPLEDVNIHASVTIAPAAVLGIGMLYRLTRAEIALRHSLSNETRPERSDD